MMKVTITSPNMFSLYAQCLYVMFSNIHEMKIVCHQSLANPETVSEDTTH